MWHAIVVVVDTHDQCQRCLFALVDHPHPIGRSLVQAGIDFFSNPFDRSTYSLDSTDELLVALTAARVDLVEGAPTVIDGLATRVFDYSNEFGRAELQMSQDDVTGWRMPHGGRLWVVEHPDRGLLVVGAGVRSSEYDRLPDVLAAAETLTRSLEFVDVE